MFNIDLLLMPIPSETTTGFDIRFHPKTQGLYQSLRDARNEARTIEREIERGIKRQKLPDWTKVINIACKVLQKYSKDIEIAAWLMEALLREYHFYGLLQGCRLIKKLCENYWDNLHPQYDESGFKNRLATLMGLNGIESNGTLIAPLLLVYITQSTATENFTVWDCQQAIKLMNITSDQESISEEEKIHYEKFLCALKQTSINFFDECNTYLLETIKEFQHLEILLNNQLLDFKVDFTKITQQLKNILETLNVLYELLKDKKILIDCNENSSQIFDSASMEPSFSSLNPEFSGSFNEKTNFYPILPEWTQQRKRVLENIESAIQYFKIFEPHSPISYLLERCLIWSNTPLPNLISEWLNNENEYKLISQITGMPLIQIQKN